MNAQSVTVTADGVNENVALDKDFLGLYAFTHAGTSAYTFTAKNGAFSTSVTYDNVTVKGSENTPEIAEVKIGENVFADKSTHNVLLNSTATVSAPYADSYEVKCGEENVTVTDGTFKVEKSGTYTIRGINSVVTDETKKYGPALTVTFNVTLGTPEIRVGGVAAGSEITLPVGGGEIELFAADSEGNNAVASFDYKVNGGETKTVTGKTLPIKEIGTFTYAFTAYSEGKVVTTPEFAATIIVPEAPKTLYFVKATSQDQIADGSLVVIGTADFAIGKMPTGDNFQAAGIGLVNGVLKDNVDIEVFRLAKTGENQYTFQQTKKGNSYIKLTSKTVNTRPSTTADSDDEKINVSFDGNKNVILESETGKTTKRHLKFYRSDKDFRNYTNSNGEDIQLYIVLPKPATPTLTVNGEAVTVSEEPIIVREGDNAVFTSTGAAQMVVNGTAYDGESYSVTVAEEGFVSSYTVYGKNETGDSEKLTVNFKLDFTPAAPVVKIGERAAESAETVCPGDVMTVTAAEGTTLVYMKAGVENVCDGNIFSYTFSPKDYILNADGTVNATPVAYTFKARKGELESELVTLNVTVQEPVISSNTYRLVISAADLQDGKKYLMVAKGENKVAANSLSSDKINVVEATPVNDKIDATDDMMVLELEWQATTNDWRIKSNNVSGKDGYHYMYVKSSGTDIFFNASDENIENFKITVDEQSCDVSIERNASSVTRMILYHTNCFGNYAKTNKDVSGYADVQLYVQEEAGLNAGSFEEFRQQCELHPGREVKFVEPLAIKAHYGNELWMEDKAGTPVYATYKEDTFKDYLMGELNANRTFWNFSGKAMVEARVTENAPVYVEITSIDAAYEMDESKGDALTGKVPYFVDLTGDMAVPMLGADPAWWSFGQMQGSLLIIDGEALFTTTGGQDYNVLTDLANLNPEQSAPVSHRRYESGLDWNPGDTDFFTGTHEFETAYIAGTIMPDAQGDKAILAMRVSGAEITGVETVDADDQDALVDVYNMQGMLLRSGVRRAEALRDLPAGIYIAGGKKVLVRQ